MRGLLILIVECNNKRDGKEISHGHVRTGSTEAARKQFKQMFPKKFMILFTQTCRNKYTNKRGQTVGGLLPIGEWDIDDIYLSL